MKALTLINKLLDGVTEGKYPFVAICSNDSQTLLDVGEVTYVAERNTIVIFLGKELP